MVAERGKSWIKHQHPTDPARAMLDVSIGPIHYGADDDQEIDTAWEADTGAWQYRMVKAGFNLHARNILNVGDIINYADPVTGENITFQPLGLNWVDNVTDSRQQIAIAQAVTAQVTDDILYFPDGYGTGRHFRYRADTGRLSKQIIIDSAANLPAPTVSNPWLEIEFIFSKSSGVTEWIDTGSGYQQWDRTTKVVTANRVEYRTPGGAVLWTFDFPRAVDADGSQQIGLFQFRRQGANRYCTVRIPKPWIDTAVFPILIDPTIEPTPGASADDAVEDTSPHVSIAQTQPYVLQNNWLGVRFANVTVPVGATIDVAYVSLYLTGATNTIGETYYFEAADSGAQFAEADGTGISGRSKTSSINDTHGSAPQFAWYNTASLVTPLQAVINRGGWASGNAAVFLDDHTDANSYRLRLYDNGADYPKLHIEYITGGTNLSDSQPAYAQGQSISSDSQPAFAKGQDTALDAQPGFLAGQAGASDSQPAYAQGQAAALDAQLGYLAGQASALDSQPGYLAGQAETSGAQPSYLAGSQDASGSQPAYLQGQASALDNQPAYLKGIGQKFTPDGVIGQSGSWVNELGSGVNLQNSVNEQPTPDDATYVWHNDVAGNEYVEFSLSNPAGSPGSGNWVIHWRGRRRAGAQAVELTIELRQGVTVIASQVQTLSDTDTEYSYTLSAGEVAQISDPADLRLRVRVSAVT